MSGAGGSEAPGDARAAHEEGLAAFGGGDLAGAHVAFERAHRRDPRDPRFMSWYGLTLVLVERNSNLGISLLDQALRTGPAPDLLLNSARAHLALNQRERAVRAVARGLELWPRDPALLAAKDALGWRARPVVPFLSRNNPLNRMLGRMRHRWRGRGRAQPELSPATLGLARPAAGEEG